MQIFYTIYQVSTIILKNSCFLGIFQFSDPPSCKTSGFLTLIFLESSSTHQYKSFKLYISVLPLFRRFNVFLRIFQFSDPPPLAPKLGGSSPNFFFIWTLCIPYYQFGMVPMSWGQVKDKI